MKREDKTERMTVRLSVRDVAAIEKGAARAGMASSEYMRACTLTMLLLDLDPHAFKMLGRGMLSSIEDTVQKLTAHGGIKQTA